MTIPNPLRLVPGINVVSGFSSSGKTLLAECLRVDHLVAGGQVVYLDAERDMMEHSRSLAQRLGYDPFAKTEQPRRLADAFQRALVSEFVPEGDSSATLFRVARQVWSSSLVIIDQIDDMGEGWAKGLTAIAENAERARVPVLLLASADHGAYPPESRFVRPEEMMDLIDQKTLARLTRKSFGSHYLSARGILAVGVIKEAANERPDEQESVYLFSPRRATGGLRSAVTFSRAGWERVAQGRAPVRFPHDLADASVCNCGARHTDFKDDHRPWCAKAPGQ